ncbi:MAG: hypothetical protein OES24_01530 [Acidimicrobiia bacterium]|nr:hypothetical protein [Acidimicrobiia bacterium]
MVDRARRILTGTSAEILHMDIEDLRLDEQFDTSHENANELGQCPTRQAGWW